MNQKSAILKESKTDEEFVVDEMTGDEGVTVHSVEQYPELCKALE